jgi:hypothetical protein
MGRVQKKLQQHEKARDQPGAKTELVDADERGLEMIKDAVGRELFADSPEKPAISQFFLGIRCLHASSKNPSA